MHKESAADRPGDNPRHLGANCNAEEREGLSSPAGAGEPALPGRRRSAPSGGSAVREGTSVGALIFDMDGTMVDSMPFHQCSWVEFAQRRGLSIDVADLMRRTTGRTGAECMRELFQRDIEPAELSALIEEKESLYRQLFGPVFAEVPGFRRFAALAQARGFKVGVGSAGDKHNIAFALNGLKMATAPLAVVGGDEGLPGKPDPAIFLEAAARLGVAPANCIVFEDAPFGIEAARRAGMRAVAVCTGHSANDLSGPHVMASVRDYNELIDTQFLGKLHAAPA
jgi:beta-phosphoglucomutase-like phosphatase (HAD superfamily)